MKYSTVVGRVLLVAALGCSPVLAAAGEELQTIRRLADSGQYERALQHLEDYLSGHPNDAEARFLEGLILVRQHRTQPAIEVFQALTQDHPGLPEPYNNLAVLYASQGQYDMARDALLTAINTHPSYAKAHENLGNVYARMASIAYDRALELNQDNKTAQLKLDLISQLFMERNKGAQPPRDRADNAPRNPDPAPPSPASQEIVAHDPAVETQPIIETVQAWLRAWSSRDADAYLGFYAPDFRLPQGTTRHDWQTLRRERLRGPRFIKVQVRDLEVTLLDEAMARVSFRQFYRSNRYRDETDKVLVLTKRNAQWRILEEWAVQ